MKYNWPQIWGKLGARIMDRPDEIDLARVLSSQQNPWFTLDHIDIALQAVVAHFFNEEKVSQWMEKYPLDDEPNVSTRVGIICAGNIPMVGLHDIVCVLTAGHHAVIKLSSKDLHFIPTILRLLVKDVPDVASRFSIVDKLHSHEAVIATGSNNSLRYFKSYFGHLPHIFRCNRTSIGILTENEDDEFYNRISQEIFTHFGLGCRNISKLFVPRNMNFDRLFQSTLRYSNYQLHSKYGNNFIYHTALFQMNLVEYLTNDLFILLKNEELHAPLSVVYYEYYDSKEDLELKLNEIKDELQVIYSSIPLTHHETMEPGSGQTPGLSDYADRVDTMKWLSDLTIT